MLGCILFMGVIFIDSFYFNITAKKTKEAQNSKNSLLTIISACHNCIWLNHTIPCTVEVGGRGRCYDYVVNLVNK